MAFQSRPALQQKNKQEFARKYATRRNSQLGKTGKPLNPISAITADFFQALESRLPLVGQSKDSAFLPSEWALEQENVRSCQW